MHTKDARHRLEKTFPLTDLQWQLLMSGGYLDELEDDLVSFAEFKATVRSLFEAPKMKTSKRRRSDGEERFARLDVLSDLLAEHARDFQGVINFRHEELSDELIRWEDVTNWIETKHEQAGDPTGYALVPLDDNNEPMRGSDGAIVRASVRAEMLRYAGKDDKWSKVVATRRGHTLDRLRRLVDRLVNAYPWTEGQAATFVLTDIAPLVYDLRVTTPGIGPMFDGALHPWMRHIVLTIDPALSVEEVANAYARVRRDVNGGNKRTLSRRLLDVAAFSIQYQEQTWAKRWELWNKQHPQEQYTQPSNFRRDAYVARDYLLAYR